MKIFDARFVGGTILTGVGTIGVIAGLFALLPPNRDILIGIILIVIFLPTTIFGFRVAKNMHPDPEKTSIEILRKTGLLSKKNKK